MAPPKLEDDEDESSSSQSDKTIIDYHANTDDLDSPEKSKKRDSLENLLDKETIKQVDKSKEDLQQLETDGKVKTDKRTTYIDGLQRLWKRASNEEFNLLPKETIEHLLGSAHEYWKKFMELQDASYETAMSVESLKANQNNQTLRTSMKP